MAALNKRRASAVDATIGLRDARLHPSSLMLLRIVDLLQQTSGAQNRASSKEVYGYYQAHRTNTTKEVFGKRLSNYTLSGIHTHLNVMVKRGLLKAHKEHSRKYYQLTQPAINLLDSLEF